MGPIIVNPEHWHHDSNHPEVSETESQQLYQQLKALKEKQHKLLQCMIEGFPESQAETESRDLLRHVEF